MATTGDPSSLLDLSHSEYVAKLQEPSVYESKPDDIAAVVAFFEKNGFKRPTNLRGTKEADLKDLQEFTALRPLHGSLANMVVGSVAILINSADTGFPCASPPALALGHGLVHQPAQEAMRAPFQYSLGAEVEEAGVEAAENYSEQVDLDQILKKHDYEGLPFHLQL